MTLHTKSIIQESDKLLATGNHEAALKKLRELSLDEFSLLLSSPPPEFENLHAYLPQMASDEVQISWTGNAGWPLLQQSIAFMRSMEHAFLKYANRKLSGNILDYGCGWGRLLRLALYYEGEKLRLRFRTPFSETLILILILNLTHLFIQPS